MKFTPLFLAVALSLVLFGLPGCATNTGNPSKDRAGRVTNATLSALGDAVAGFAGNTLVAMASQELSSGGIDMASAASAGLYASAPSVVNSKDIENIINAWSGNTLPTIATKAAQKFAVARPITPADKIAVTNAIAAALTTGAQVATIKVSDSLP
jgi:hypothetical protein